MSNITFDMPIDRTVTVITDGRNITNIVFDMNIPDRPGQFSITKDRISLFDALAMAGDLTIYGQRENVALIREENGMRTVHYFDLKNPDILTSPYFYLQQDDVVYVTPNKYKAQAGEINQNRSFYISLVSVAVSVATLLVTITR